jgi:hypothetical protein
MKQRIENNGKMEINIGNIRKNDNIEERNYSFKMFANKSKSLNKKNLNKEYTKELEVIIEKKYINFDLDFIYRREKYTLKNLLSNYLISRVKKLISKKLSVDYNLLHIYYLDKEIIDDKLNVYDLIENNKIKYLEVKKESPINENVLSLSTNLHLIYKIRCKGILNAKDFIEKIETFFRERGLDKHYLCEPVDNGTYDVGFSCEDNCFQFKRYMMIIKKIDKYYTNVKCQFLPIDRNEVFQPYAINYEPLKKDKESIFINKGPFITYEDIKKRNEKEQKKKWICNKDFI